MDKSYHSMRDNDVKHQAMLAKLAISVWLTGGSIGERNDKPVRTFYSEAEAKAFAKSRNARLTPGEKSYYKMRYVLRRGK